MVKPPDTRPGSRSIRIPHNSGPMLLEHASYQVSLEKQPGFNVGRRGSNGVAQVRTANPPFSGSRAFDVGHRNHQTWWCGKQGGPLERSGVVV